jgi:hypothetical protein
MRTATTAVISEHIDTTRSGVARGVFAKLAGLAFASFLPAAFWTSVIAAMASLCGSPLSTMTVSMIAGAISLFLLTVCAPLMLRGLNTDPVPATSSPSPRAPERQG